MTCSELNTPLNQDFDIIIAGSGLVGPVAALSLVCEGRAGDQSLSHKKLTPKKLKVAVIEKLAPNFQDSDGRTTAVSFGSRLIFEKIGLWDSELESFAQPIDEITVFEHGSAWSVNYNSSDVFKKNIPSNNSSDNNSHDSKSMGYIIENTILKNKLLSAVKSNPNITFMAPAEISAINYHKNGVDVRLKDGESLSAKLLIGAEGRNSFAKSQSSITSTSWDYNEVAVVFHIKHEKPHYNRAFEVFTPTGALALLPMLPCPDTGAYRSGIVWMHPRQSFENFKNAATSDGSSPAGQDSPNQELNLERNKELARKLYEIFPLYGDIEICSRHWVYPLSAMVTKNYVAERLALVGDAAHVVHPIAGQGVNLGWRDAAVLAEHLLHHHELGLDIGSATVLKGYEQKRLTDRRGVLLATDGISRLFGNSNPLLYFARNAGLGLVNMLPPLKKWFVRKAMGK